MGGGGGECIDFVGVGVRGDQHMMSSCEPPTKKIYLYPYFMFKGQERRGVKNN